MKKDKGFSLVELLAVVIILAILALILIPFIGNLIKESKIHAAVVSAYGYVEATNNAIVSKQTKGEDVVETQYDIEDSNLVGDSLSIKYEGKGPSDGWFVISRNKVTEGEFCINGYDIKYIDGKAEYIQDGEICPGAPLPPLEGLCANSKDPEEGKEYAIRYIEDLVCLSQKVNAGNSFLGITIVLENDLDFKNASSYKSNTINTSLTSGSGFTPIGTSTNPFNGTFRSSNLNTISNLYINRTGTNNVGMFGYIGTSGIVGEFNLANPKVYGNQSVGSVAGYNGGKIHLMNISNLEVKGSNLDYAGVAGQSYIIENMSVRGVVEKNNSAVNAGGVTSIILPGGKIDGVISNVNVHTKYNYGGIFVSTNDSSPIVKGVVEGGKIYADSYVYDGGKAAYHAYSGTVYTSSAINCIGSSSNGNSYNKDYHSVSMFDDVLDTYYGGDDDGDGYYFDYDENNNYIVKKVNAHSFDTQIRGSGTQTDPYILASEQDFKDAALLVNQGKYFKLADDIDVSTFIHFYPLGTTSKYFNGHLDGNNKTISNMNINGGQYTGLISYLNNGSINSLGISNSVAANRYHNNGRTGILVGFVSTGSTITNLLDMNNITVSGKNYTGGVVGYTESGVSLGGFNITTVSVTGNDYVGGVAGHNGGTIYGMNVLGVNVVATNTNFAGVAGESYILNEIVVRGNVEKSGNGVNGAGVVAVILPGGSINNVLSNVNVHVKYNYAGVFVTTNDSSPKVYAVVEGGKIYADTYIPDGGRIAYHNYSGVGYASTNIECAGGAYNGTSYSPENNTLEYFGSIKYTVNNVKYPLFDSNYTGDVNNSGYWFAYKSNGDIYVTKTTSTGEPPSQPVCTENCSNPSTYPLESSNVTGTCPSGDVTAPTCTFNYFVAVTNGIRASFSCTDDTSVPTVASMFNSTTKATYTFAEITDQSRGGTVKTGTVSGNTRNITSTWTTQTVPSNPPTRGLCYYYQMAAIDSCGNEGDYTTSYCYYGFSNPQ